MSAIAADGPNAVLLVIGVIALYRIGARIPIPGGLELVHTPGWAFRLSTMLTLTAGSACLMWIGDQITERHIGNGMFLMFVAALLAAVPGLVDMSGLAFALRQVVIPLAVVGITSHVYRRAFHFPHVPCSGRHREHPTSSMSRQA